MKTLYTARKATGEAIISSNFLSMLTFDLVRLDRYGIVLASEVAFITAE